MAEMNHVLDTLLASLLELIPCDSAQVLLTETADRLFLARERRRAEGPSTVGPKMVVTWNTNEHDVLAQVLLTRSVVLVRNTAEREAWKRFKGHSSFHSWIGVPLIASGDVLGLLSLGDFEACVFTQEHLRLAKSLAIPGAVAIQNARLYEKAEIYGSELEKRLADLDEIEGAVREAEARKTLSEENFTRLFQASPIPFALIAVDDSSFIELNDAWVDMYGYPRDELTGRSADVERIWADSSERTRTLGELRETGRASNFPVRMRKRSGELIEIALSAEPITVKGRQCVLLVAEERNQFRRSVAATR